MSVLLLSRDLLFPSRVRAAAELQGLELATVSSIAALANRIQTTDINLVLVDLTCPGISPAEVVGAAARHDPVPRLVGFGPHVQELLLESARDAGFDQVLGNGEFTSTLAEVLRHGTTSPG